MGLVNWLFDVRYEQSRKNIPFNPLWMDDMGRFSYAVDAEFMPRLNAGELAHSTIKGELPRRILFVGTDFGPLVLFEKANSRMDLGLNVSPGLKNTLLFRNLTRVWEKHTDKLYSEVSPRDLELILGDPFDRENPNVNLGHIISGIRTASVQINTPEVVKEILQAPVV